jgi:hypothetical protein
MSIGGRIRTTPTAQALAAWCSLDLPPFRRVLHAFDQLEEAEVKATPPYPCDGPHVRFYVPESARHTRRRESSLM